MLYDPRSAFPRRTFLKGAAAAAASTLVHPVWAQLQRRGTFSVAFWDGSRFVPAEQAPPWARTQDSVLVSLRGFGTGDIVAVDAGFPGGHGEHSGPILFRAWDPGTCAETRLRLPVAEGARFDVTTSRDKGAGTQLVLSLDGPGPRLSEGSYVIAEGTPNWAGYRLRPDEPISALLDFEGVPASFQYLLLGIHAG